MTGKRNCGSAAGRPGTGDHDIGRDIGQPARTA